MNCWRGLKRRRVSRAVTLNGFKGIDAIETIRGGAAKLRLCLVRSPVA